MTTDYQSVKGLQSEYIKCGETAARCKADMNRLIEAKSSKVNFTIIPRLYNTNRKEISSTVHGRKKTDKQLISVSSVAV